jgi:uncharacterized protein YjbI with pentapeptide repeats
MLGPSELPWLLVVIGAGFVFLCYLIPPLIVWIFFSRLAGKDRADTIDAYRKTMAQVFGGFALVFTFGWTIFRDSQTIDQGRAQLESQQFFQRAQLANQQFVEGAKLLKEDIGTSAAGVHALGQVAASQPEFQSAVVTTLASFIKSQKETRSENQGAVPRGAPGTIPANVQAALSVISRRDQSRDSQIASGDEVCRSSNFRIDLYGAYLVRARFTALGQGTETAFRNVNFQAATLYGAHFQGLDLTNTAFDGSRMADWDAFGKLWNDDTTPKDEVYLAAKSLFTVNLDHATLRCSGFDNVQMGGAILKNADLEHVSFWRTDLSRADLTGAKNIKQGAHFVEAILRETIFTGTDLEGVSFQKATLRGTDFRKAKNVDKAIFTDACSEGGLLFDNGIDIKFQPCS